jgi:hypothetical protein
MGLSLPAFFRCEVPALGKHLRRRLDDELTDDVALEVWKNSVNVSSLPREASSRRSMNRVPYWRESWDRLGARPCSVEAACQLAGKSARVTRWIAWRSQAEMSPPAVIATASSLSRRSGSSRKETCWARPGGRWRSTCHPCP